MRAVAVLRVSPNVPLIFVSGTLGEDVAIEALKIGATDYILKTRLSRLGPSVHRAIREARERAERKQAEEALRRSEAYLAEAQRLSGTGSFGWNPATMEVYWSEEIYRILECDPATRPSLDFALARTHPEDRELVRQVIDRAAADRRDFEFEHRLLMPNASVKYLRVVARLSAGGGASGDLLFVGAVMDITERKQTETDLQNALLEVKKLKDQLYQENVALKEEIDKKSMFEEIIVTVAGGGACCLTGDRGPATNAYLVNPMGVAVDGAGDLFIADEYDQRVRRVSPDGIITTMADIGSAGFSGDGEVGLSAQLWNPTSVALDSAGDLFIADLSDRARIKTHAKN